MQLTEKERDLLVDTLIESLWQFPLEDTHRSVREMIVHKVIMPNVEGVLADRAAPEHPDLTTVYQKGYQDGVEWLDKALDSVHPRSVLGRMFELRAGGWEVRIAIPDGPDENGWYDYTGNEVIGTGPTRKAAIEDAIAQAKEHNHE